MGLPLWHHEVVHEPINRHTLILFLVSHLILLGPLEYDEYRVQITLPRDPKEWSVLLITNSVKPPDRILEFCGLPDRPMEILATSRRYTLWNSDNRFDQTMFDMMPVTPVDFKTYFDHFEWNDDTDYKHTIQMSPVKVCIDELPSEWSDTLLFVLQKQDESSGDINALQIDFSLSDTVLEFTSIQFRRESCLVSVYSIPDDETYETAGWLISEDDEEDQEIMTLEEAWETMIE